MIVDLSRAHLWDTSAVAALDTIESHYRRHEVEVRSPASTAAATSCTRSLSGSSPRRTEGRAAGAPVPGPYPPLSRSRPKMRPNCSGL